MAVTYTDTQIGMLLAERKLLPSNWLTQFQRHPKRGHDERAIVVTGADGNEFHLLLRKSLLNYSDSQEALECLIADAGFETDGLERPMFPMVPEV